MRVFSLFVAVATASISTASIGVLKSLPLDQLTVGNHYGAPIPPWESGCHPGFGCHAFSQTLAHTTHRWYYGNDPQLVDSSVTFLSGVRLPI